MRWLLPTLALIAFACGSTDQDQDAGPEGPSLVVFHANVGNLDGACGGAPYRGGLCSLAEEAAIASRIQALAPDIAILQEIVDSDYCTPDLFDGDVDALCTGAPARSPYQSARRLVGDDYTITCDGIAHYDCIAVRRELTSIAECPAGDLCMGASETPSHPAACDGIGSITSVSAVHGTFDGQSLTIVGAHPLNAITRTDDACREAQYRQAFEDLPDGRTLIAGDMNFDPYRVPDYDSAVYWHSVVGDGNRFTAHSVTEEPPVPTWQDLATLDYVLSDFLQGSCIVLGATLGTELLDDPFDHMDHRGVLCELRLP